MRAPVMQRLLERVEIADRCHDTPCWVLTGCLGSGGYGVIYAEGKSRRAHRVAYEHWVGPIPEGLTIDHLCRVRNCVNPDHLEPVTRGENARRGQLGLAKRRRRSGVCRCGQPLTRRTQGDRPGECCVCSYARHFRTKVRNRLRLMRQKRRKT